MEKESLRFPSDQSSHGFFGRVDGGVGRVFHDLPYVAHPGEDGSAGFFGEGTLAQEHDFGYWKRAAAAQCLKFLSVSEIDLFISTHLLTPPVIESA